MLNSIFIFFLAMACMTTTMSSCVSKATEQKAAVTAKDLSADTGMIPKDTVMASTVQLTRNGLLLHNNKKFSGYVAGLYRGGKIKQVSSVYEGMLHGISRSYFENGALQEVRQYKENQSTGRHYGYWPNGNMQFDYLYFRDQKIGDMKRWYDNGKPYLFLHYKNDKEEGLQQGWRDNGKLFINYVVKDGHRYGLQESMLCYKLNEGNIIK